MNGVSPFNYRPVTPAKERRMMIIVYSFFLGFGLVGAVTYPIWSHVQHNPMKPDSWVIVAALLVMACVAMSELLKAVRRELFPPITTAAGCVSLSLGYASRVGNVLELTIEPSPGHPLPNLLFVVDNAGNTYTQCSPTVWRTINVKSIHITVSVSFTGNGNFEIKLKEWGDNVEA